MIARQLKNICFSEQFGRQMRFVVGPRQTGKTRLAREFLNEVGCDKLYYNWDKRDIRQAYRKEAHFFATDLYNVTASNRSKPWICFDEIHKMPRWKNILKDFFDSFEDKSRFIVTGSARLDLLKYTGESLLGRYFTFRLFPLRLVEVEGKMGAFNKSPLEPFQFVNACLSRQNNARGGFEQLLKLGGFPEPFISGLDEFVTKWRHDYCNNFIKEDLRDLTHIAEIENTLQLIDILPSKVGSPLSVNSLREDMEVSHTAVRNWLRALKLTHVIFFLRPYTKRISRSIKKESKCYLFDWGRVDALPARFENYVAVELKGLTSIMTDAGWGEFELLYIRTKDGKETDFLITHDNKPWLLLEAKLSEEGVEAHHINNARQLGNIPFLQLTQRSGILKVIEDKYFVVSADRFLGNLPV